MLKAHIRVDKLLQKDESKLFIILQWKIFYNKNTLGFKVSHFLKIFMFESFKFKLNL